MSYKARGKTRAERTGYIPSAWRTNPGMRAKRKCQARSRLSRASHRPGQCLIARGEEGLSMLSLLDKLASL